MYRSLSPRATRLVAVAVGCGILAASSTGCASAVGGQPADTAASVPPTPSVSTSAPHAGAATGVTDIESCDAFYDIGTLLSNAYVAFHEKRMGQKEYDSWRRLATRLLDHVPTRGEGEVSEAIAKLKAEAPPIRAGSTAPTDLGSDGWGADVPLGALCQAAGADSSL